MIDNKQNTQMNVNQLELAPMKSRIKAFVIDDYQ